MKTISSPLRSLAKQTLPEVCLLLSGSVRTVRCLASGGFSHSISKMRTRQLDGSFHHNPYRKIARLKVSQDILERMRD